MLCKTNPHAVTKAAARLVTHAKAEHPGSDTNFASALQWLRALYSGGHKAGRGPLHLQIADLKGNVVLARVDAGTLVDVPLPAGTYQITARFGAVRRDYMLTLQQGTSFDSYVRLAPVEQ
jgi:hypothetical protein